MTPLYACKKNSTITNIIFSLFLNFFLNLLFFYYQFSGSLYTYTRSFITLPLSAVHTFAVFAHHTESHTSFEHVYYEINFSQGIHKKAHYFNKGNCIRFPFYFATHYTERCKFVIFFLKRSTTFK